MELHHPIMSKLWDPRGRTQRRRRKPFMMSTIRMIDSPYCLHLIRYLTRYLLKYSFGVLHLYLVICRCLRCCWYTEFFFNAWDYTGAYGEKVLVIFTSGVSHLIHVHLYSPELSVMISTTYEANGSKMNTDVPIYFSLPYYSWVLCPVLVLVVTYVLIRSYILFPVPTSSQLFYRSWKYPA